MGSGRKSIAVEGDVVIDGVIDIRTAQFDTLNASIQDIDNQIRAAAIPVNTAPLLPTTPLTAVKTATLAGATQLIAGPGVGKKLGIHYLYFTPGGPDDPPLVDVRFVSSLLPLFRGYAAGKTWRWVGAENEAVEAVLAAAGSVAFTLLYEEMNV